MLSLQGQGCGRTGQKKAGKAGPPTCMNIGPVRGRDGGRTKRGADRIDEGRNKITRGKCGRGQVGEETDDLSPHSAISSFRQSNARSTSKKKKWHCVGRISCESDLPHFPPGDHCSHCDIWLHSPPTLLICFFDRLENILCLQSKMDIESYCSVQRSPREEMYVAHKEASLSMKRR